MVNVKPVTQGKTTRMSFSRINEVLQMPNLIEVQKNSYKQFLDEGLKEVFKDISSISDYQDNLVLDFIDYHLDDKPKYTIEECKERDATYAAPLRVRASLLNKETGEVKEQDIFMGDFPLMTESGTSSSTARSVLSFRSWCVLRAFTTVRRTTRAESSFLLPRSSPTAAHGSNMKPIPTTFTTSVLIKTANCR